MTAKTALGRARLQSVPEPQEPAEKRFRSFEDMVRAIYNDARASHEARELLLAVAYAVHLGPREDDVSPLREARRVLGRDSIGRPRYGALMAADAPRYELPEQLNWHASQMSCGAPRLRPYKPRPYAPRTQPELPEPTPIRERPPTIVHVYPGYKPPRDWRTEDGVCGANAHQVIEEKDPRTGWVTGHWFCKRHQDHADRVAEQIRAQNEAAPDPIPNTGGLLPCYFKADWEKVYRHHAPYWEPPAYGLCADDWPTPGTAPVVRGRLRMVIGGDLTDGDA
jgi:hypothetical protein